MVRMDSTRPELPYCEGHELTIRPHIPPLPLSEDDGSFRPTANGKEICNFIQSKWCLGHPPVDTPPHESHKSTRKLRVIGQLAVRDQHGAQVVLCCLDGNESRQYVAKIYDPFYYPFHLNNGIYCFLDSPWKADDDYSREALSYQNLAEFGINGKFTPKFYGCWTFDTPFLDKHRPVRLILMEYLDGHSMHWILRQKDIMKRITLQNRLSIYAKVLEADTTLDFYGILHKDVSPRNVILVGDYNGDNLPKVYLIDFNLADIAGPLNSMGIAAEDRLVKPVSPRYHHWGPLNSEFLCWIPRPLTETMHFKGWLKKVWGDDESDQFGRPSPFTLKRRKYSGEAKYVEPVDDY